MLFWFLFWVLFLGVLLGVFVAGRCLKKQTHATKQTKYKQPITKKRTHPHEPARHGAVDERRVAAPAEGVGVVELRDVDDAQAAIVAQAKELAAQGQIEISEGKDEEMVY